LVERKRIDYLVFAQNKVMSLLILGNSISRFLGFPIL